LSSPLAIEFLRAGYLLPAFAFFEPDFVEPDFVERDPDFVGPDFDFGPDLEVDFDLARELPDLELPELDFEPPARDFEPPERDFEPPERPPRVDPDFESDSLGGGSGGRDTGSRRLVRSVLASRGGGSRWALSIPITSGTASRAEARWPLASRSSP
jgi:hypothetical protein